MNANTFSHIIKSYMTHILSRNKFYRCIFTCHECFQTRKTQLEASSQSWSTITRKKKSKVKARSTKQESYESLEDLVSSLKEKSTKKSSYLFEESLAKKLVKSILCNRANPKAPILEISCGIGLVSREFLDQGVEQVIALEIEKVFHPYLQLLQKEYGSDKFEFHPWNILNIYEKLKACPPRENGYTYETLEAEVVKKLSRSRFRETDTPYSTFTLGGSQENHNWIFYILHNLPIEDPILSKERIEFFFLVHPKFKFSIEEIVSTSEPSNYTRYYSYVHTFICLLYDITFIDEVEANDFVPPFSKQGKKTKFNPNKRHLVRMQLKSDISKILPLDHHYAFSIFLRHIFRKRKIRIIPVMEMLVADCGLQMLADGFTMMETVADVSPDRLLLLYKRMQDWPAYALSHLKNHILMKTQGGPMEDEDTW